MLRESDTTDTPAEQRTPVCSPAERGGRPTPGLVAQRGLFFGPSALVPEDLYSVVEKGIARRERERVDLAPGSRVSTNTYFGRFHATYWQRWTAVGDVEVSAVASGSGRLRLTASDTNKVWRIVAAEDIRSAVGRPVRLTGRIDRFVDGGGMWLEITTETGELSVADVRWTIPAPEVLHPTAPGHLHISAECAEPEKLRVGRPVPVRCGTVVTDMSEQGVRTRDRALAWQLTKRGARVLRRFAAEGPAAAARYRAEMDRLTSRENWTRLYGLDGPDE